VPIPGRFTEPPTIGITGWISDRNPDGSHASNPQIQFEKNWTAFLGAFVGQGATIKVERCMPDGSIREADCRVSAAIIPELPQAGASRIADVKVALDIPGIFWKDSSGPFTQSYTTFGTATTLNFLSPSTAPITDAKYVVTGPVTNPYISNSAGDYITYNGTVPAGQTWTVDAKAFTSVLSGTGSVLFQTSYKNSGGYLFEIWNPYKVTVSGSGTTSASKWSVTADKKFF